QARREPTPSESSDAATARQQRLDGRGRARVRLLRRAQAQSRPRGRGVPTPLRATRRDLPRAATGRRGARSPPSARALRELASACLKPSYTDEQTSDEEEHGDRKSVV